MVRLVVFRAEIQRSQGCVRHRLERRIRPLAQFTQSGHNGRLGEWRAAQDLAGRQRAVALRLEFGDQERYVARQEIALEWQRAFADIAQEPALLLVVGNEIRPAHTERLIGLRDECIPRPADMLIIQRMRLTLARDIDPAIERQQRRRRPANQAYEIARARNLAPIHQAYRATRVAQELLLWLRIV